MDEGSSRNIWGIDFSAAKSDAGRKTWIADCRAEDGELEVQDLSSAGEYLDLNTNGRERNLEALVEAVGDLDDGIVAIDFPFSLPESFLDTDDWKAFVEETPGQWSPLNEEPDPTALYESVKSHADEGGRLARATDKEHGGQNPAGYRIKTQTYYGISSVLNPLVADHDISVPPLYWNETASTTVIETYPAAVFRDLGAAPSGYKSDDRNGVTARRSNLEHLEEAGITLEANHADCAIGTDDALDALAAAYAAWKPGKREQDRFDGQDTIEGQIYTGASEK